MTASPDRAGLLDKIDALPRITDDDGGEYVQWADVRSLIVWAGLDALAAPVAVDVERLREDLIDLPFARTTVQREIAVDSLLARHGFAARLPEPVPPEER